MEAGLVKWTVKSTAAVPELLSNKGVSDIYVVGPRIDKIAINCIVEDQSDQQSIDYVLHQEQGNDDFTVKKLTSRGYKYGGNVFWNGMNAPFTVHAKPTNKISPYYMRIEFNSALHAGDAGKRLRKVIQHMLSGSGDTPASILKKARVTKIEVALDFVGLAMKDVGLRFEGKYALKKTRHMYLDKAGNPETVYLGKGDNQLKIYDKVKQMKKNKKASDPLLSKIAGSKITRVEFTHTDTITFYGIGEIENPFKGICFYNFAEIKYAKDKDYTIWQLFRQLTPFKNIDTILPATGSGLLSSEFSKLIEAISMDVFTFDDGKYWKGWKGVCAILTGKK